MAQFQLDTSNRFTITGYPEMRPFSSFLPGIAGLMGIPMWAFYVNRGQGITSFGIESKDAPIMEFQPANKAYQDTPLTGFRTFLKVTHQNTPIFYEPFSLWSGVPVENDLMKIDLNDLELQEVNPSLGLSIRVRYFLLPNEPFAGLVRQVILENTAKTPLPLEMLDGMPKVIPYGVNNNLLKEMGRTLEAWMEVFNLEARVPFYRLRASVIDRAEVETFQAGHFALAFADDGRLLPAIVDPARLFGYDTTFYKPANFITEPLEALAMSRQITCGRTPCGFFGYKTVLNPGEARIISSVYGHCGDMEDLAAIATRLTGPAYLTKKYQEAIQLVNDLTEAVATQTRSPLFDAYCRQNFLDNVLRGGWPVQLADHIFPVYSRKHGDPERDYNAFFIPAEPYSQGESSYRDVNQNRRDDVLLNPAVGDYDIHTFISLLQADGYNPRAIKNVTFKLQPEDLENILKYTQQPALLRKLLSKPFAPGGLLRSMNEQHIELSLPMDEFLRLVFQNASQDILADFHEGYWIDHWEYNLDLIESYLTVYPDRKHDLLFGKANFPFFDSPVVVQPRARRYVLVNGVPRQLNCLAVDPEKQSAIALRKEQPQWARTKDGRIYRVPLFAKLALIVILKFSSLDPLGMGIEMEASRPGWDDALNGIPGLFGSGMSETYELLRWMNFLQDALSEAEMVQDFRLPREAGVLFREIVRHLDAFRQSDDPEKALVYWDAVATAREMYRERVRIQFDGSEINISRLEFIQALDTFREKVMDGIHRAETLNQGLPPTYFIYRVDEFDVISGTDPQGHAYIRPKRFTPVVLPLFLEGPVHAYKTLPEVALARSLYQRIKASPLYDQKLNMYKLNASLADQPQDIGRARAFPPGWLENESIWLHMEYKYLLEVLKAGLFEQFYDELKNLLVPFQDPARYGRSVLENSSFLVSSAHPDEAIHGAGFVARLSGSTAEFISIWHTMMAGPHPFVVNDGQLCLSLQPAIPGWLFTDTGEVSFCFLGKCMITYHNPERQDTHHLCPDRLVLTTPENEKIEVRGPVLKQPYAEWVRSGLITKLDIWL